MLSKVKLPLFLAGLAMIFYRLWSVRLLQRASSAGPCGDFESALARGALLQSGEPSTVRAPCSTLILHHGRRSERSIVLLHGFTNCPYQFTRFAEELHRSGYSVVVPRLPHHGMAPMATDLAQLTADDLIRAADEALNVAHGLGERVTLFGFSLGGSIAAWLAQHREDIDHTVMVAPALSLSALPDWARSVAANLLLLLPNRFYWWDSEAQAEHIGPAYAYPRFATRALGALLLLAENVVLSAGSRPAPKHRLTVVINPSDDVLNNETTEEVVECWRARGAKVSLMSLPAESRLRHDFMDPSWPDQQLDLVYPALLSWIEQGDDI